MHICFIYMYTHNRRCVCAYLCTYIYLSINLSIYIYLSIYLPIDRYIHKWCMQYVCTYIHKFVCMNQSINKNGHLLLLYATQERYAPLLIPLQLFAPLFNKRFSCAFPFSPLFPFLPRSASCSPRPQCRGVEMGEREHTYFPLIFACTFSLICRVVFATAFLF